MGELHTVKAHISELDISVEFKGPYNWSTLLDRRNNPKIGITRRFKIDFSKVSKTILTFYTEEEEYHWILTKISKTEGNEEE